MDAVRFAKHMRLVKDEAQALIEQAKRNMAKFYDANRKAEEFDIGDKVYISTRNLSTGRPKKKWDDQRIGLYAITEKISSHTYKVALPPTSRVHPVFHVSLLTRWILDEFERPKVKRVVLNVRGEDWNPEKVLQSRVKSGRLEYQVQWKGQPSKNTTWELATTMGKTNYAILEKFHKDNPDAPHGNHPDVIDQTLPSLNSNNEKYTPRPIRTAIGSYSPLARDFIPEHRLSAQEKREATKERKAQRTAADQERFDAEVARIRMMELPDQATDVNEAQITPQTSRVAIETLVTKEGNTIDRPIKWMIRSRSRQA
jgi:hypothetical protein